MSASDRRHYRAPELYDRQHGTPPPIPPPITPAEFAEVRALYGSRLRAAEACGVTVKQIHRWEAGTSRIPRAAYHLLHILARRDLGAIDETWVRRHIQRLGTLIGALLYRRRPRARRSSSSSVSSAPVEQRPAVGRHGLLLPRPGV